MVGTTLDLPKPLQNMLGTLISNHILSSWNIYSSGYNIISVNIWFSEPAIASVDMSLCIIGNTAKQVRHRSMAWVSLPKSQHLAIHTFSLIQCGWFSIA